MSSPSAGDKKNIVKMAYIYFQEGRWDKAIEEYKKLLALDPEDFNARNMLGDVYVKKGDVQEAYAEYAQVAKEMQARGQHDKVKVLQRKIGALDPEKLPPEAKKRQAVIKLMLAAEKAMEEGNLEEAQNALNEVVQVDPDSLQALAQLGELLVRQGKKEEAVRQFLQVGNTFLKNRLFKKAQEYLQKVVDIDPGNLEARGQLAQIFIKQGSESDAKKEFLAIAEKYCDLHQYEKAEEYAKKAIEYKSIEAHYVLGLVYFRCKKFSDAKSEFEELLRFKVNHLGALVHLTLCLLETDKADKAQEYLQRAQKVDKDSPLVREALAELHLRKGAKADALKELLAAADGYLAQKAWDRASQAAKRASEVDTLSVGALIRFGEAHAGAGRASEASNAFLKAAQLHEKQGQKGKAAELYEKALQMDSGNAEAKAALQGGPPPESPSKPAVPEPKTSRPGAGKVLDLDEEISPKAPQPEPSPPPPARPLQPAAPEASDSEADLKAQIQMAEGYIQQGLVEEAIEVYQQMLEAHPEHAEIKNKLNEAYTLYLKSGEDVLDALEAERRAKEEEARKLREEIEKRARQEAERRAREEAEARRRQEEEKRLREQMEQKLREEAARNAEASKRAEEEKRLREEIERKVREEIERKMKEEIERKAKEEAELKAREEALRKALEEAEAKAREASERKARQEAELKARDEHLLKAHQEMERKLRKEETGKREKPAGPAAGDLMVGESGKDDFMTIAVADIYTRQGLHEEARKIYRKIIENEPDNFEARKKLADLEALLATKGGKPTEVGVGRKSETPAAASREPQGTEKDSVSKRKSGKVSYL